MVGITGFTHLATTKVLGIQNQFLTQCQYAKMILQLELPLQVDGEVWMQEAGANLIMHKNQSRMLVKDKVIKLIYVHCVLCGWDVIDLDMGGIHCLVGSRQLYGWILLL